MPCSSSGDSGQPSPTAPGARTPVVACTPRRTARPWFWCASEVRVSGVAADKVRKWGQQACGSSGRWAGEAGSHLCQQQWVGISVHPLPTMQRQEAPQLWPAARRRASMPSASAAAAPPTSLCSCPKSRAVSARGCGKDWVWMAFRGAGRKDQPMGGLGPGQLSAAHTAPGRAWAVHAPPLPGTGASSRRHHASALHKVGSSIAGEIQSGRSDRVRRRRRQRCKAPAGRREGIPHPTSSQLRLACTTLSQQRILWDGR